MKFTQYFIRPYTRRFPHPLPVAVIGYCPRDESTCWHREVVHTTFNVVFILNGKMRHEFRGKQRVVQGPSVITDWPGRPVSTIIDSEIEELYIAYPRTVVPVIKRMGLADMDKPVWAIHQPVLVSAVINQLFDGLKHLQKTGGADRIDRLCEMLLMESVVGHLTPPSTDPREQAIRKIQAWMECHYIEACNLDRLIRSHGMSPTCFRRHWKKFFSISPGHYLMHLRIQEACRLLTETQNSIKEIAAELRFSDPFHFSKTFHRLTGQTASSFRSRQQGQSSSEKT